MTYVMALLNIHDRTRYSEYEAGFMDIFSRFEGEVLAVDEQPSTVEGEWPWTRTVLLRFPNKVSALAWYESDAYQQLMRHRQAASAGNITFIEGLPV